MGLLSRIENGITSQSYDAANESIDETSLLSFENSSEESLNQKKGGLLSKAQRYLNGESISDEKIEIPVNPITTEELTNSFDDIEADFNENFTAWAIKRNYQICGVFSENYGYFVLCDMHGLNAKTAVESISSADFWQGTLEKTGEWEMFSQMEENITPFYQLFSEEDKENIKKIFFLPKNIGGQNVIVFIASSDEYKMLSLPNPGDEDFVASVTESVSEFKSPYFDRDIIEKNIKAGFYRYHASCFVLSVKLTLEYFIKNASITNSDIKTTVSETIYNAILNELRSTFALPNCATKKMNYEIKILFFANERIEPEVLRMMMDSSLSKILGKDLSGISLISAGTAENADEAKKFLF